MDPVLLGEALSLVMFATVCVVLLLGFPVAFTLGGVALAFATLGLGLGIFDFRLLGGLASRYFGGMVNELLRSEERRVGKEGVSTGRYSCSPRTKKTKKEQNQH